MLTWLGLALAGPAMLLAPVFPGFGTLDRQQPTPPSVERAVEDAVDAADVPPYTGGRVAFNDPHGSKQRQYALVTRYNQAIRSAEPGSTVRLAAYSFAMWSTANALLAAHERGVNVRVIVDDHVERWGPVKALARELGTDTSAHSFLQTCRLSCRGGRGNQHAKFLTVSEGRLGEHLLMVGSMNLTRYSAERQYNDLYWVFEPAAYARFTGLFDRMAKDRPQPRLALPETRSGFVTDVAPYRGSGADALRDDLARIRCDAAPGAGRRGRTVVRIAQHAWNGERGIDLARQVAGLQRAGCDVRVLYGVGMGRVVANVLRDAGVPIRDSEHDRTWVHHKMMLVSGGFEERTDVDLVWTGSHNWSDRSTRNDEVLLRVAGRPLVERYLAAFDRLWTRAARP